MIKDNKEEGFILVTVIVLLAILTVLGVVGTMKSQVEMKVSVGALESEQAFAAMKSGLNELYGYWGVDDPYGKAEFKAVATFVTNLSGSAPAIYVDLQPNTLIGADSYSFATSVSDVYTKIEVDNPNIRVYTLNTDGSVGVDTYAWGATRLPQSAVWVSSYTAPTSGTTYPYFSPNHVTNASGSCPSCGLVAFSIGRSGDALRFGREYMSTTQTNIQVYGAMSDAPKYANRADWCLDNYTSTSSSRTTGISTDAAMRKGTHMIDATQAPGGTAIASNGEIRTFSGAGKPWKSPDYSSGVAFDNNPYILYDPGKDSYASDYPKIAGDWIDEVAAKTVDADKFAAGDPMNYFEDAGSQLFQLDVYREAANRISGFMYETISGYPVEPTGASATTYGTKLGNAQALADANLNGGTKIGRTGTLQWFEARYNIENAIPMYGLVRIMIPVIAKNGNRIMCTNTTPNKTIAGFEASFTYNDGTGDSSAQDAIATSDASDAVTNKLIVYGAGLFEFFYDADGDELYDPSTSDRILTPQEALTFKVDVEVPLMFNPVMDGTGIGGDATHTSYTDITKYPVGAPSWDQTSDKLSTGDGAMDLIWDVYNVGTNWATKVHTGTSAAAGAYVPAGNGGFSFSNWMTNQPDGTTAWDAADKTRMTSLLDYYYQTTRAASKATFSHDTIADVEASHTNFFIDTTNDLSASEASAADLFHAFLPSGYVHGWKRAFAETGLGAASGAGTIWSEDLLKNPLYIGKKRDYFYVTRKVDNSVHIDKDFADLPAEMYAGGLVDMHEESNVSGPVYSQGQLELEQKSSGAHQYINGIVISGYGTYLETNPGAKTIIAYDPVSTDNLPTANATTTLGRKYWQELQ